MIRPDVDHQRTRPPGRRLAAGAMTAAAWAVYAWLWAPVVTALACLAGIRTAWLRLYLDENGADLFLLLSLPLIALGCAVVLIGWAEYNRIRFAREDRRRRRAAIDEAAVRRALRASDVLAHRLRQGRIVQVALDDDAFPLAACSGD